MIQLKLYNLESQLFWYIKSKQSMQLYKLYDVCFLRFIIEYLLKLL